MNYYSLTDPSIVRTFDRALRDGIAPDRGLYFPERIPVLDWSRIVSKPMSLPDLAFEILRPYVGSTLDETVLRPLLLDALDFDIPLVQLDEGLHVLELFHGPTAAFKDVGARIMARLLAKTTTERLTVLVATSGDTGSAVAQGFLDVPGIDVVILYPSGRISHIQEQQLTTVGRNIRALEVQGNFDDCQALVKQAFMDDGLKQKRALTSANSINIGRWIPQAIYYAWAAKQCAAPVHFVVPSGNFGNVAAGMLLQNMGVPILPFIAATNANDGMASYLKSGVFEPKLSVATCANAMDVGDPSNRPRIEALCENSFQVLQSRLLGYTMQDQATRDFMQLAHEKWGYLACPHTAIALAAAHDFRAKSATNGPLIALATAHPAKFGQTVEQATGVEPELPNSLRGCLDKKKTSTVIPASYKALRDYLWATA
jgi:threonine synthase